MKKEIASKLAQGQYETTGEKGKNIALFDCSFHLHRNSKRDEDKHLIIVVETGIAQLKGVFSDCGCSEFVNS